MYLWAVLAQGGVCADYSVWRESSAFMAHIQISEDQNQKFMEVHRELMCDIKGEFPEKCTGENCILNQ